MGNNHFINEVLSTDILHNHNAFAYLSHLKPALKPELLHFLPKIFQSIYSLDKYDQTKAYGDLYSKIMTTLEDQIDSIYNSIEVKNTSILDALDHFMMSIYHNNNKILENIYPIIQTAHRQIRPGVNPYQIKHFFIENQSTINKNYPSKANSISDRFQSLFSPNFNPQTNTNIPSLKNYSYKKDNDPIEYRFSTQAQRQGGIERVSSLFIRWLEIKAKRSSSSQPITHIYFNNLGFDRSVIDIAGSKERSLSLSLHHIKDQNELKLAVITLPADKGLLDISKHQITDNSLSYDTVYSELYHVALGNKHHSGYSDIHMSQSIEKLLFSDKKKEAIGKLLTKSFGVFGIQPSHQISTAQKQAVWVHFIKFELTDYIINTLKPESYNFTCKDAIDRGALSSVYYNLMKSIELDRPIRKEEFEIALDAAAMNVKGRGMNTHRLTLWNVLDYYINTHYDLFFNDKRLSWLIFWRDMNCPDSRINSLLKLRVEQIQNQFQSLSGDQKHIKEHGKKMINSVMTLFENQVSDQNLLLEIISHTSELLLNPTENLIHIYKEKIEELKLNHNPTLYIIAGWMELILGACLFILTLGFSNSWMKNGMALTNTGFFALQRETLYQQLCEVTPLLQ